MPHPALKRLLDERADARTIAGKRAANLEHDRRKAALGSRPLLVRWLWYYETGEPVTGDLVYRTREHLRNITKE